MLRVEYRLICTSALTSLFFDFALRPIASQTGTLRLEVPLHLVTFPCNRGMRETNKEEDTGSPQAISQWEYQNRPKGCSTTPHDLAHGRTR